MTNKKYELTDAQKNIYMLEKVYKNTSLSNILGVFNIYQNFSINIANSVIKSLIANNDILNSKIIEEDNNVYQILKKTDNDFEVLDYSNLTKKQIDEIYRKESNVPFDILNDKLYKFKIIDYGKGKGAILVKLHHLISDAWTFKNVAEQLSKSYENILNNNLIQNIVRPSYTEYIESVKEYKLSDKYLKDKEFWKETLKDLSVQESLSNKVRTKEIDASRYTTLLTEDENILINNFARENKISVYNLFLTALYTYIYKVTNMKDIVIGTPVLGRSNFKEKQMMGMFISTIPLRVKIEESMKVSDLYINIAKEEMGCFRHQKYPFADITKDFNKDNNTNQKLFNIMLSFQNARANIIDKNKYETDWIFSGKIQSELEIHIMDMDNTGTLTINYDYLNNLFSFKDIEFLHKRIISIVKNIILSKDVLIGNIDILCEEEKSILDKFNNTKKEYDYSKGIAKIFEDNVEKNKDKVAVIFNNKNYAYEYLNKEANKFASYLKDKYNVKSGDKVSFVLKRDENILICMLAAYKLGITYIPIDITFPLDRIEYMIDNSDSKLVIVSKNLECDLDIKQVNITDLNLKSYKDDNLNINCNDRNKISYMIYTSGTTGKPKGCMIYEKSILNLIYAARDLQKLNKNNIFGSFSTYSFDISVLELLSPLVLGATIVLADEISQNSPEKLYNLIKNHKIEIINMTPTRMKILLENEEKEGLKYLKNIMLGGEVFPKDVYKMLKKYTNANIYDGYGPTEITVWSSAKKIEDENNINIGVPLNNMTSYVLDDKNNICPLNVKGQLCVGGVGVAKGYYNNEKLTNEKFINVKNIGRIYKTGDIVYIDYNGDMHYSGRIDNQIKLNGLRIEIDDIESNLKQLDNIENSAVIVKNNKLFGYYKSNIDIDTSEIIRKLSLKLPNYMVPKIYMRVDKFYMTTLGKIDKTKLPEIKQSSDQNIILAKTDIEKYLYNEISLILNIDNFGINTNLIELGMDSLSLISLTSRVSKKYSIYIGYNDMFENQTILELEKFIIANIDKEENKSANLNKVIDSKTKISNAQKSVVNDYLLNNQSLSYNIPFELKISAEVDIKKLITAIEKVIKTHNMLFSNLKSENNEIYLNNNDNVFKLNIENINCKEYENIKLTFLKPFNLFEDRLFDIKCYNVNDSICILFNFSHLIFDGTSFEILLKEIFDEYNDKYVPYNTSNLAINYSKEEYDKAKDFYLDKFSFEVQETEVKLDYKRSNENVAQYVQLEIEETLASKLSEIAKNSKVTLNNVYLGSLIFLLSKYTYNENITVGIANDSRLRENKINEIGMFVNSIPYRYNINLENSINDYLKDIQVNLVEYTKNSIYGYEELIKDLKYERQLYKNPLFNIFYVFQNEFSTNKFENIKVDLNEIKLPKAKMDMLFEVSRVNGNVKVTVEYNSKLYKQETIKLFLNYYNNLLNSLVIVDKLKDIEIISSEEKNYILNQYNDIKTDYSSEYSINKIFENIAFKHSLKTALVFEGRKVSYKELNEKANSLAREILKYKLPKNSSIALVIDKSLEHIIGMLAIIKCGYSFCPINLDIPDKRAEYMMENAGAELFLTTKEFDRNLKIKNKLYIDYVSDIYINNSKENLNINISSDDLLYIIYTSGTTGLPKGTKVIHKGITRLVLNTNYVDYTSDDIMLCSGSTTFDTSMFEVFGALLYGMTLHIMRKINILNPEYYAKYLIDNNITTTLVPTPIFNMLSQNSEDVFKTLKTVYVGGDTLLNKYVQKYINEKVEIINIYGPTENSVISSTYKLEKRNYDNISIGKPISNSTCYIVDKCGKLSPKKIYGQLYVGGDGLALGYINRDELTKEKFVFDNEISNKIYKTGDLTAFDDNYNIDYYGRIDMQVKIRGQRIELLEIQNQMLEIEGIKEVIIMCKEHLENKYLVSYYTSTNVSEEDIKKYLRKYLPEYMIPSKFIKIDKMPLNQNGKIQRDKLPEVIFVEDKIKLDIKATKEELKIIEVFKSVLKNENINCLSDFFVSGGDSLNAVNLVLALKNENINITYADIFKCKTPRGINEFLNNNNNNNNLEDISKFDYTMINKLLQNNKHNRNNKMKNVLLTGSTGFLGIHILKELVQMKLAGNLEKIYCLVRKKKDIHEKVRLKKRLEYYFDNNNEAEEIFNEIEVIHGDLTSSKIIEKDLNIDTIINCAAYVYHYGKYETFKNINEIAVNNLIKYCLNKQIKLVQISTTSVSGEFLGEGIKSQINIKKDTIFNENKLYIGQNLNNYYLHTKYMAEKNILDNIVLNNLDAEIIRIGNLTSRYFDGKVQIDNDKNAFMNKIRTFKKLKVMPKSFNELNLEFSCVDLTASAIVNILNSKNRKNIYHVYNDNYIQIGKFNEIINKEGFNIKGISDEKFKEKIKECMKNNESVISGIITDLDKNGNISYLNNIVMKCDETKYILNKNGFVWNQIDKEYINKFWRYFIDKEVEK